jgi:uncharacterized protein (TIGR02145 family)
MNRLLSILTIAVFALTSCKKNSTSLSNSSSGGANAIDTSTDQLSQTQIQLIEDAGVDSISTFADAKFDDGTNMSVWAAVNDSGYVLTFSRRMVVLSASDKKRLFIERMTHAGLDLIDDSKYLAFSQPSGIAYVYNSKSIATPYAYAGATCTQKLHGLDCSGMIYQMSLASGLNLILHGTINYVKTATWNSAFNNSVDFKGLEMMDLSALAVGQLQAGDMIVASGVHIGMVFNNGNGLKILNSLGRKEYSCLKNSDALHGAVITNNIQAWLQQSFGSAYHVLRCQLNGVPGVTTSTVSSITSNSANAGGIITDDGGSSIISRGVCWGTASNPTTSNFRTTDGTGTGEFVSSLITLNSNTTYYLRAYATNSQGTGYGNQISFTTSKSSDSLIVTDVDGNAYHTVTIGTQVWMIENLKVGHYRNGDPIANVTDSAQWIGLTTGAWCYYGNNTSNDDVYGKLYNWYAVNDGNIAPTGWHVPTYAEWITLATFLGGDPPVEVGVTVQQAVAGGKMKSTDFWTSPNTGATNESGFNGLPGGFRRYDGPFYSVGTFGYWWSFSEKSTSFAWGCTLGYDSGGINIFGGHEAGAFSVRCVKD